MLTRVGFDGSIRQTLLPVAAHDVEVAPDRSIGVLCSMDGEQHSAFDPDTLEMAAVAPSLGEGWRGGGHAVYLDGRQHGDPLRACAGSRLTRAGWKPITAA